MGLSPTDIKVKRAEGLVNVAWSDGEVATYGIRQLRCACACAACVDEFTGAPILDPGTVPDDIGISGMDLVGNYAVRFAFSDGHDTGIYSWRKLLALRR